jgi:hypothetical protein
VADPDLLTIDRLSTPEAVLTLGAVAVRALQEQGVVVLFVGPDGEVQMCPPEELMLDASDEEQAISKLLEQGRNETEIITYLKARAVRTVRRSERAHVPNL